MTDIYWIHIKNHKNILSEGYIGISTNSKKRLYEHKRLLKLQQHENPILQNAFNKHQDNLIYSIILKGNENYCLEIEEKLRPFEKIGWNVNKGGFIPPSREGVVPWNKDRKFIWITDGTKDKTLNIGLEIPEGWQRGRHQVPAMCGWNRGQTKETNEIIKRIGEANKIHRTGKSPWNKGLTKTDTRVAKHSKILKGIPKGGTRKKGTPLPKVQCPHCNKVGGLNPMKQWHFDHCKKRKGKKHYISTNFSVAPEINPGSSLGKTFN